MNLWSFLAIIPIGHIDHFYLFLDRAVGIVGPLVWIYFLSSRIHDAVKDYRPHLDVKYDARKTVLKYLFAIVVGAPILYIGGLNLLLIGFVIALLVGLICLVVLGAQWGWEWAVSKIRDSSPWWRNLIELFSPS